MKRVFLAVVALAASPVVAQETRRASIYPFAGDGVTTSEVDDVEAMVKSALLRIRGGALSLTSTDSLSPSCGPASTAPRACLAKSAGSGVVIRGVVRKAGVRFSLTLAAIDGEARLLGPFRVELDPRTGEMRPAVAIVNALGEAIVDPGAKRSAAAAPSTAAASAASAPAAPQTSVARAPARAEAPPSWAPAPVASIATPAERREGPQGAWMEPTGRWLTIGGAVALAGGAVFGYLGKQLNDDLAAKYRAHTLSAADSSSYRTLDRYGLAANALLIAGGALALTGATLWSLAPEEGGMSVGLTGHF